MNVYILLDVVILIELQKYKKILPPPKLISVKIEAFGVWMKSIWSFHPFRRGGIFVGAYYAAAPFCYHINGFMDLEQSIDDDFFIE